MAHQFTTARVLEKLKAIKTEKLYLEQLKEFCNYKHSLQSFRAFIYSNKIPFKRKKPAKIKPLLDKLNGIDTKNISIGQIAHILKYTGSQENLMKHLKKNSIEFNEQQK